MYPEGFINWIGDKNYYRETSTGYWIGFPDSEKDWITIAESTPELYELYKKEKEHEKPIE